jgi:uncharacterized membrane protein YqhA
MKLLEVIFEGALWNSRFVIIAAVIGMHCIMPTPA